MAGDKGKALSAENSPTKKKRGNNKTATSKTTKGVHYEDERYSEDALNRMSERMGVPASQISHMLETLKQAAQDSDAIAKITDAYNGDKSALIQVLLQIQRENRWLPKSVLISVCERLGVPISQAYRIATFYKAFSLTPQGRHGISVCMGTACHVRQAPRLLDRVKDTIGIQPGETSADEKFTLETVNCLGCCALGPVMVVDDKYYSNPSVHEIEQIVNACE